MPGTQLVTAGKFIDENRHAKVTQCRPKKEVQANYAMKNICLTASNRLLRVWIFFYSKRKVYFKTIHEKLGKARSHITNHYVDKLEPE